MQMSKPRANLFAFGALIRTEMREEYKRCAPRGPRWGDSPTEIESIAQGDLELRLDLLGRLSLEDARRESARHPQPLRGELPVPGEFARPREGPRVSVLTARTQDSADLMGVEIVEARGETLRPPLEARERERGAKPQV